MTRLILVRHAESTWNLTGRYQGRIDTDLSEKGERQAALVAERLKSLSLSAVYSSPLRRALLTAISIGKAQNLDVQTEPELIEIDHGAWNGLSKAEVEKRYGSLLQLWFASPSQVRMPEGESLSDVSRRAKKAVDCILEEHSETSVALCSHNAVLKVIIADAIGMNLDCFWYIGIDSGSISIIEFGGLNPRLLCLNDTCHLGEYRSNSEEQAL